MARIHLNDLTPTDGLTPEQEEQILGAGRPSFRPMLESLENRVGASAARPAQAGDLRGRADHPGQQSGGRPLALD